MAFGGTARVVSVVFSKRYPSLSFRFPHTHVIPSGAEQREPALGLALSLSNVKVEGRDLISVAVQSGFARRMLRSLRYASFSFA